VPAAAQEVHSVTASPRVIPVALTAILSAIALVLVPAAIAGKGGGGGKPGGGGGGSCTASAPTVTVDNNWSWSGPGTYGLPGQQLKYVIHITNNSCSSGTFTVGVSAPSGFSVSLPTSSISLGAKTVGYLYAYVTSPTNAADGDYPVSVSMSGLAAGSFTSYYKVYSSDTAAPTLFWPAPGDGATITGRSYNVGIQSSDDHSVKDVQIYIDGALKQTSACADISYTCQSIYTWSPSAGSHTATFTSSDWMGNVATQTVHFTVS
jgi:hypothetical protein